MRRFRLQFTIGSLVFAVALAGLNLAGIVASVRSSVQSRVVGRDTSGTTVRWDINGRTYYDSTDADGVRRIDRVLANPPAPTLQQIWSPLIASASFTIVVLGIDQVRRRLRGKLTIRFVIVALALVGLNFAAAVVTWRSFQNGSPLPRIWSGPAWLAYTDGSEGIVRLDLVDPKTGARLIRVVMGQFPPSLVEIWSPVIASVSISLLVFLVPFENLASWLQSVPTEGGDGIPASSSACRRVARWAVILAALIGLNGAGAVQRPQLDASEQKPGPNSFVFHPTMFLEYAGASLGPFQPPVPLNNATFSPRHGDQHVRVLDTVIYRSDGGIVAYEGNPGLVQRVLSWPRVIQPPTRSLTEMWWPVAGSVSITLLVLDLLWRQGRRRRARITDIHERIDQ
jgi:hypothetical protein